MFWGQKSISKLLHVFSLFLKKKTIFCVFFCNFFFWKSKKVKEINCVCVCVEEWGVGMWEGNDNKHSRTRNFFFFQRETIFFLQKWRLWVKCLVYWNKNKKFKCRGKGSNCLPRIEPAWRHVTSAHKIGGRQMRPSSAPFLFIYFLKIFRISREFKKQKWPDDTFFLSFFLNFFSPMIWLKRSALREQKGKP